MDREILVDPEDAHFLEGVKWSIVQQGRTPYARRRTRKHEGPMRRLQLHREIMQPPDGMVVDHINGNGLDNRRANLRIVTHQQNCQHRVHIGTNNKTGSIGVKVQRKKFIAFAKDRGVPIYLGSYTFLEDAVYAREQFQAHAHMEG